MLHIMLDAVRCLRTSLLGKAKNPKMSKLKHWFYSPGRVWRKLRDQTDAELWCISFELTSHNFKVLTRKNQAKHPQS